MTTQTPAFIIRVQVRPDAGRFFASSPDVPGLHVWGDSRDALCERVVQGIKFLFRMNRNIEVEVTPLSPAEAFPMPAHLCNSFAIQQMAA